MNSSNRSITASLFLQFLTAVCLLIPLSSWADTPYEPEIQVKAETEFIYSIEDAVNLINSDIPFSIIEVSKSASFNEWHLPGAVNVYRPQYSNPAYPYKGMIPTQEEMEALLGSLGVASGDFILIYDDKDNTNACRMWWMLGYYGYSNMAILNQGKAGWERTGQEKSTVKTQIKAETFQFEGDIRVKMKRSREQIEEVLANGNALLLDTRKTDEYSGDRQKDGASRPGHIPGSLLLDYTECLHFQNDGTPLGFHSPEVLKNKFEALGITPDKDIIVYCHSGMRSSLTYFALTQLLHYPQVSNYDGSWVEWSYFPELPAETGAFIPPLPPVAEASDPGSVYAPFVPNVPNKYVEAIKNGYVGTFHYIISEVTFDYDYKPWWQNFFYWLLFISGFFFLLEIVKPWRQKQAMFRKDFWLDFFYMFFNVFLFGLFIFVAGENLLTTAFNDFIGLFGLENIVAVRIDQLPVWAYFLILFVSADFIQWNVHRLLHRVPRLWEFHKVHHSVEQMGFAAHLRYHWMENIVYKSIQAIPLTMLGYNLVDLMVLHMFNLAWGHFNHSNITVNPRVSGMIFGTLVGWGLSSLYGTGWEISLWIGGGTLVGGLVLGPFMRYIFNSPEMHIWHHAKDLPDSHPYGINFGLTLACWDWIFGTAHVPRSGRDIPLGFPQLEKFPKTFWQQAIHGFGSLRKSGSEQKV